MQIEKHLPTKEKDRNNFCLIINNLFVILSLIAIFLILFLLKGNYRFLVMFVFIWMFYKSLIRSMVLKRYLKNKDIIKMISIFRIINICLGVFIGFLIVSLTFHRDYKSLLVLILLIIALIINIIKYIKKGEKK